MSVEQAAESAIAELQNSISGEQFREWYDERQYRQNIENGQPYFNGPPSVPEPKQHRPSQLLKCNRKITYRQQNAPEESEDPNGIFWVGSRFEEELVVSFLREIVGDEEYVTNSIWVDFTVKTDAGELRIKGETDPIIVDSDAKPLLLTEIKTKESVENVDSPNTHHRAQAHAYMAGLSKKYDRTISQATILYGSRKTLNVKAFDVDFDPYFWRNTVLSWAATHTTYRLRDELPPADPEHGWECGFCSFRERCGEGNLKFADVGPAGLLPGFTGYPRAKVITYLEANDGAKLTPSLAHQYPDLVDEYGAFNWKCSGCGATKPWDAVDWEGDVSMLPRCSACPDSGPVGQFSGPTPAEQAARGDSYEDQ